LAYMMNDRFLTSVISRPCLIPHTAGSPTAGPECRFAVAYRTLLRGALKVAV